MPPHRPPRWATFTPEKRVNEVQVRTPAPLPQVGLRSPVGGQRLLGID